MKVKYFIYEDLDTPFPNDPMNKIRYFIKIKKYEEYGKYFLYIPYIVWEKTPEQGAILNINKKYLRRVTEEEFILDKLTR